MLISEDSDRFGGLESNIRTVPVGLGWVVYTHYVDAAAAMRGREDNLGVDAEIVAKSEAEFMLDSLRGGHVGCL